MGDDGGLEPTTQVPRVQTPEHDLSRAKRRVEHIQSASPAPAPGLRSSSNTVQDSDAAEEDLASPDMPPETTSTRRSTRLNSKKKPEEERDTESRVPPTSGSKRLRPGRRAKSMKPKPMSPQKVSQSRSVSADPDPQVPNKTKLRETATTLKRKGQPEVEELLSAGSSATRPIDVDALNTVLERFPVKREPQVKKTAKCPLEAS